MHQENEDRQEVIVDLRGCSHEQEVRAATGENDRMNKKLESCDAGTHVVHFARMPTSCVSFEARFNGDVNVAQVQPTFQLWTQFRDKSRIKHTSTCDRTTDRLSIHNEEHHLRNGRQRCE